MNAFLMNTLLLIFLSSSAAAQENDCTNSLSQDMLKASLLNSRTLWDRIVSEAESTFKTTQKENDLVELAYAYYGSLGNCLSDMNKDKGLALAEKGIDVSKKLSETEEFKSLGHALLSGFYGMSIAFNPMKGMTLGPKSDKHIKEALKINEENPFAWLQKGSSQFNTPRIFGGSVTKSIESFKKSISFYEKQSHEILWLKIEAMIWLGQAYHEKELYKEAETVFKNILEIAPGYQWVERILLPRTTKKLEQ